MRGTILEVPTILGVGTGMRLGEVLGLRWSDVDLEKKTARISQTLQETHDGVVFVPPKTHRSRRGVSLPDFVVSGLRQHKKAQSERRLIAGGAWRDFDLVIDRGDGQPLRTSSLRPLRICDEAGWHQSDVPRTPPRSCLADVGSGSQPKGRLRTRLGHSTIGITADLYTHVADQVHEAAAASLDALLGPSVKGR